MTIRHVAVVVPAADEQAHILACVTAVDAARRALREARPDVSSSLVVALDRCTDATAALVAASGTRSVPCAARSVGPARAVGTAAAVGGLGLAMSEVWLANTDADSRVPEGWLCEHVRLADSGAGLLLGTVLPGDSPALDRWVALHDTADGHRHVHGANLGVRADVLATLGGWPALPTGEDVALAARAERAGVAIARTGRCAVWTSHRMRGRAPSGFADYLAALEG